MIQLWGEWALSRTECETESASGDEGDGVIISSNGRISVTLGLPEIYHLETRQQSAIM